MARKKELVFHLPEADYSETFIRVLAIAVHLDLIKPPELTYLLESGKTIDSITNVLGIRITDNIAGSTRG